MYRPLTEAALTVSPNAVPPSAIVSGRYGSAAASRASIAAAGSPIVTGPRANRTRRRLDAERPAAVIARRYTSGASSWTKPSGFSNSIVRSPRSSRSAEATIEFSIDAANSAIAPAVDAPWVIMNP